MENSKSIIILLSGNLSQEIQTTLENNNVVIFDINQTNESASDKIFNESKFFGLISISVASGNIVAIRDAELYMTKKGNLSLLNSFTRRIPGTSENNYNFITVSDIYMIDKKLSTQLNLLLTWSKKNATIMSYSEFLKYEFKNNSPIKSNIKVTCGLTCKFFNDKKEIEGDGHKTCAYNISIDEANKLLDEYKVHFGQEYDSKIISLNVENKQGGHIISIPKLGATAHITLNTCIKSSLSGPVLEKFNQDMLKFNLIDIDPTIKQNKTIELKHSSNGSVEIIGWYMYAVDS